MVHQREFRSEHPPFSLEREIAAGHVRQRDVLSFLYLADVFVEARPERPAALRRATRCLADIDQVAPEVERIDAALGRGRAPLESNERAVFQPLDKLVSDSPVQIKFEAVRIVYHLPL